MSKLKKSTEAKIIDYLDNITYTESGHPILPPILKEWVVDKLAERVYEEKSGPLQDIAWNIYVNWAEKEFKKL